jgi:insulysin
MTDIIVSPNETRKFRSITLDNGLQAILIQDTETTKAGAALDVHVGSGLDPEDWPGLAHFCEHMLFMGTEKYPSENEYSEFITNHGGMNNAYTSLTSTNYQFEIAVDVFAEALDKFA